MQERIRGNEYRTTVVCVDSYHQGIPVGRFYNPSCKEGKSFESLSQLLVRMEDIGTEGTSGQGQKQSGQLATFAVRVLFRQNASWQGEVTWLEGKREESFRSVLELILLMDGALQESMGTN